MVAECSKETNSVLNLLNLDQRRTIDKIGFFILFILKKKRTIDGSWPFQQNKFLEQKGHLIEFGSLFFLF